MESSPSPSPRPASEFPNRHSASSDAPRRVLKSANRDDNAAGSSNLPAPAAKKSRKSKEISKPNALSTILQGRQQSAAVAAAQLNKRRKC